MSLNLTGEAVYRKQRVYLKYKLYNDSIIALTSVTHGHGTPTIGPIYVTLVHSLALYLHKLHLA